ncbi:MAG: TetR/AcrR family transcriptional regulator, partial [Myxococcaceae bacterium]
IDDLARAAGISKGLLYHYFPTKRDYYVASLAYAARRLVDDTLLLPEPDLPAAERLRRGLETYLDFVERHSTAFVALLRGGMGSDPKVTAILERTRATFVDRILEQVPAELATPLVRLALRGWVGFVEAVATEWVTRHEVKRPEILGLLEATLLGTVQAVSGHSLV